MGKTKRLNSTENETLPKSNVLGVSFTKKIQECPWMFSFQKKKQYAYMRFKTQEEAEEAAFALFERLGYKQTSEVRGVYYDKKYLKRSWETRIVVGNDLVYRKHFETQQEAEEVAKDEFGKRNLN